MFVTIKMCNMVGSTPPTYDTTNEAGTLMARDYKGVPHQAFNGIVEVHKIHSKKENNNEFNTDKDDNR